MSNSNSIRVLVVDDSSLMRLLISDIISSDDDIEVIDTAVNGKEAVEKVKELKPDVVLLDMTMKDYDGFYAVKHIMKYHPTPIVIVSALGNTQPEKVFDAINEGAFDFVNKPTGALNSKIRDLDKEIIYKIKDAANAEIDKLGIKKANRNHNPHTFFDQLPFQLVLVGASTGGTGAIEEFLKRLPENFPLPIVIAQHIPHDFVYSFANRLDRLFEFKVKIARETESLQNNTVYILPANVNSTLVQNRSGKLTFGKTDEKFTEYNFPSIDSLFESVAKIGDAKSIAILMTGMGRDGANGLLQLRRKGSMTIAQSESSCVVFGMPKAAIEIGAAEHTLHLNQMSGFVVSALS
ncbi:MAG: chemotaxis-specific protein-glutamate methyltransferase CheB [Cyclobacteriaceae bacterium]|nr:chemotaxis-specific protein-glutamate methyltransferase CheB [Cyclobacteriaceae bacterium]MCH8516740.1 chemotaxis-specific protein-glutamate methyltransferase CheB [Cyclobacteriaceae bacterium]